MGEQPLGQPVEGGHEHQIEEQFQPAHGLLGRLPVLPLSGRRLLTAPLAGLGGHPEPSGAGLETTRCRRCRPQVISSE